MAPPKPGALPFGELTGSLLAKADCLSFAELASQQLPRFGVTDRVEQGQLQPVALDQGFGFSY